MSGTRFLLDTCFILGFYKKDEKVLNLDNGLNNKFNSETQ